MARSVNPQTLKKWRRVHAGAAGASSATGAQSCGSSLPRRQRREFEKGLVATSWEYGQLPGWNQQLYDSAKAAELRDAEVIGCASSKILAQPGPGDHTAGIHGPTPHFAAESWRFGSLPNQKAQKYELPLGAELQEAGLIRRSRSCTTLTRTAGPGDHTNGLGSTSHLRSEYQKIGQVSGWRAPEFGAPAKHTFSGTPTFPEIGSWRSGNACNDRMGPTELRGPEDNSYRPGDHTLGIRSSASHFSTTYDQHGQVPGSPQGRRHNFGPVIAARLRLTEWQ